MNIDNPENELWVEKYRPRQISNFIGNKDSILLIKKWINDFQIKSPEFKPMLLLVGDPGVGKTTLANVILNEYKYDIIEINASKLEGKTEIHKHFDNITRKGIGVIYSKDNKTGVILDEVDGMAQNDDTMNEFLSIIDPSNDKFQKPKKNAIKKQVAYGFGNKMKKSPSNAKNTEELSYEDQLIKEFDKIKQKKKEEFKKFPYKYPIICTANKATDKRMKKLIKHAIVVQLKKPSKQSFIKLAKKIVKEEDIDIKNDALDLLVERSNSDFRQLVSNLQMVSMQENITINDINVLVRGRDIDQNLFDIVDDLLNHKNNIEDIILLVNSERRPISNMIYHNLINVIDYGRMGKRKEKVQIISKMMESIAEGQQFYQYTYDDCNHYNAIKNIIQPIMFSQELKINTKGYNIESYNIQNYKSQETKTYSNYVSHFIDKFGTYDTKTIFQLCYIIISGLSSLNLNASIVDTRPIHLMRTYDITIDDLSKMCKICALVPDINIIQNKLASAKYKRDIQKAITTKPKKKRATKT